MFICHVSVPRHYSRVFLHLSSTLSMHWTPVILGSLFLLLLIPSVLALSPSMASSTTRHLQGSVTASPTLQELSRATNRRSGHDCTTRCILGSNECLTSCYRPQLQVQSASNGHSGTKGGSAPPDGARDTPLLDTRANQTRAGPASSQARGSMAIAPYIDPHELSAWSGLQEHRSYRAMNSRERKARQQTKQLCVGDVSLEGLLQELLTGHTAS